MNLDREYGVIKIGPNGISYMFVPPDEQSSAAMFIDGHFHNDTERSIAEMYEGAEVTKSAGKVNGKNVERWRWKDSRHFLAATSLPSLTRMGQPE